MKKAIDKSGFNEDIKKQLNNVPSTVQAELLGVAGDTIAEPVPKFVQSKSENVITGQNNSWIVLGRDRPASRLSGYGGIGDTQCASIDLVVGRMAHKPKSDAWVDPNFKIDAARIYISQKTDIDENFGLASGKVGNSTTRSGIGIKADGIRIVAREGIKLITGTDISNSQGGDVDTKTGIDIIANNDDSDLQPMVKGNNLAEALDQLVAKIEELSGILSAFLDSQMEYNSAVATHTHISPFFGIMGPPSEATISSGVKTSINKFTNCVMGLKAFKVNLVSFKNEYIRVFGQKYINSKFNSVN